MIDKLKQHFVNKRIKKNQELIVATAQMLLKTPDLSYKSTVEILVAANELYDMESNSKG